jgi:uncharacterized protein (TIGR01777 family)
MTEAPPRILVTGAGGFVGRNLCALLHARGHELVGLSRNPVALRRRIPELNRAHAWMPEQGPAPAAAFEGVDAVVHLAGEPIVGRWTRAKRRRIRDSRIIGTQHLVQGMEALARRPEVLISASAIGYYGNRGDDELVESDAPGGDFLAVVCVDWEEAARGAEELGLRVVLLRLGLVLGRGGGSLEGLLGPAKLGLGGPIGTGRQWWSWIHQQDALGIVLHALGGELRGPVNATAPNPMRQRAVAKTLGKRLGRPSIVPAPAAAVRLALGEFAWELLSSKRVLPQAALESGYAFHFEHLEAALADLLGPAKASP